MIPKVHVMQWHELEPTVAAEMAVKAHSWARRLIEAVRPDGYNILINNGAAAGQDVFHVHVHITPRSAGDGYYTFGGHHSELSDAEATELARRLEK